MSKLRSKQKNLSLSLSVSNKMIIKGQNTNRGKTAPLEPNKSKWKAIKVGTTAERDPMKKIGATATMSTVRKRGECSGLII